MHLVRLFEITGHLGKQLIVRHAYIDRKMQPLPHSILHVHGELLCGLPALRRRRVFNQSAHIHKCLIDRNLLHKIRIGMQNIHQLRRASPVQAEIGADKLQRPALFHRLPRRLTGLNPVFLRRYRLGRHDGPAEIRVRADRRRNRAQINAPRVFTQPVDRRPGQKSRIDVHMKNKSLFRILHLLAISVPSIIIEEIANNRLFLTPHECILKQ